MSNKNTKPNEEKFLCACTPDKEEEFCNKRKPSETQKNACAAAAEVDPGYSKKAKHYYSIDEWDIKKALSKLLKRKRKWNPKKCGCCKPDPDKIPETECRIRVEAWHKHDWTECEEAEKEYEFIGEIIFPFCSRKYLDDDPGIPVRQSLKSFCINNRKKFGDKCLESRKYAYQGTVLTTSCVCK